MSLTQHDYDALLNTFVKGIESLNDDVAGVMIFGSMARDEVKPGISDAMDAFVSLKAEVFEERERYLEVLDRLADLSGTLAQYGIEYHPFFWWNNSDSFPALFLTPCRSDKWSKSVYGADFRKSVQANETSRGGAAKAFYELRRRALEAHYYLVKLELTPAERHHLAHTLSSARKYLPFVACAAIDIWDDESVLVGKLQEAFPTADFGVLQRIAHLRDDPSLIEQQQVLCKLLEDLLALIEAIYNTIRK